MSDGDEVSDSRNGARGGCAPAKQLGDGAYHVLQPVDVRVWCGGLNYSSGRRIDKKTDKSTDRKMFITQDTKSKTRNLELGSGLESRDVGDYVNGIEYLEGQVSAKDGKAHRGRPHKVRTLFCDNPKKIQCRS